MRLLIAIVVFLIFSGCNDKSNIEEKFKTRDEYRCKLKVNSHDYSTDSLLLIKTFTSYVKAKDDPFNAAAYNENTLIYIDTIIYSSDMRYCAVLAIEKYLKPNDNSWTYDGGVHFAFRDKLDGVVNFRIYSNCKTMLLMISLC